MAILRSRLVRAQELTEKKPASTCNKTCTVRRNVPIASEKEYFPPAQPIAPSAATRTPTARNRSQPTRTAAVNADTSGSTPTQSQLMWMLIALQMLNLVVLIVLVVTVCVTRRS